MLHLQQIKLLRQWRELQHSGKQVEAEKLLIELFLTVNAISGGLRTTG
jgi:phosphoenolpyruvate carboxylase